MLSMIFEKIGVGGLISGVAGVIIVVGAIVLVNKVDTLTAENAQLHAAYDVTLKVNGQLAVQLKENQAALAIREKERVRLADETARLNAQLKEVYENDETARNWSVCPMPDSIFDRMFQAVMPATDTTSVAPGGLPTNSPGANVERTQ